jgi:uncharacterized protein
MARYENERAIKKLKLFLKKIKKRFKLENSILFGSRARGDYLLDSDVDLILVSKDFDGIPFRKRMGECLEFWNEEIDLEVICYTSRGI